MLAFIHHVSIGHASIRHASIRHWPLGFALAALLCACIVPDVALAANGSSEQNVECKLPGEIRSVGGHSMMSAGRIVQTTSDDCRQRGGEYTVQETAPAMVAAPASPAAIADDGRLIACLLPAQTRQLGEKARYKTYRPTVRITRTDCQNRGGSIYTPRKSHTTHKKA